MKSSEITDVSKCVGCSLCADVCPKQCIEMRMTDEGFRYPAIDESLCIDCKACQRTCPVNGPVINEQYTQTAYLAMCKDRAIYYRSSSGGVFYNLAKRIINAGGCVFGAAWNNQHQVEHICAETEAELMSLLGSKYIQSNTAGIWKRLKAEVKTGRKVLFSGTPCQIGALRSIYKTVPENLLVVEVICMGVPSPGLFGAYIDDIQRKTRKQIKEIRFREKQYFGTVRSHSLILRSDCGTVYARTRNTDPFFLQFLNCNTLRRSCYDCSFKSTRRGADLTLGDCWGLDQEAIQAFGNPIVSVVMANTAKGEAAVKDINEFVELADASVADIFRCQPMLTKSCHPGPGRNTLFKQAPKGSKGIYKYLQKAGGLSWVDNLKVQIVHLLYQNK